MIKSNFIVMKEEKKKDNYKTITNGEMIRLLFDDRSYNAIKEKMQYTLWWTSPYCFRKVIK